MKLQILMAVFVANFAFAGQTNFSPVDINEYHKEEVLRESKGLAPRFAKINKTKIDILNNQNAFQAQSMTTFRHIISSKTSVSLNLAFENIKLSANSKLSIFSKDLSTKVISFKAEDIKLSSLWTPVIESDELVVELVTPTEEIALNNVVISRVNQGFRKFSQSTLKS